MEYNQFAIDGTVYNNGYGICMIPKTQVNNGLWNTTNSTKGGYISSNMHTTVLPNVVSKLQNVLGNHIVNRNVLLSDNNVGGGKPTSYTWTTAYATLMSIGQMTGTFAANNTKYDDGEANYKLPLFNSEEFKTSYTFWSRGIAGTYSVWVVYSDGSLKNDTYAAASYGVRPIIYIR